MIGPWIGCFQESEWIGGVGELSSLPGKGGDHGAEAGPLLKAKHTDLRKFCGMSEGLGARSQKEAPRQGLSRLSRFRPKAV